MKDRIPTYPGRIQLTAVNEEGTIFDMVRADEPTQEGTLLNKATLLTDATATQLGLSSSDPTVNEALAAAMPLNRGVWHSRTAVPGVTLGTEFTFTTATGAAGRTRPFSYVDTLSVSETGVITTSGFQTINVSYDTVETYADTLTGKYFWASTVTWSRGTYGLFYATGSLVGNNDDGSTSGYYLTITAKPVYPALTVGSWGGEFSDSASAHTRGIASGYEYQYDAARLSEVPYAKIARGVYAGKTYSTYAYGRAQTKSGLTIATLTCGFYPLILYVFSGTTTYTAFRGVHSSIEDVNLTWNATNVVIKAKSAGTCDPARESTNYPWLAIGI